MFNPFCLTKRLKILAEENELASLGQSFHLPLVASLKLCFAKSSQKNDRIAQSSNKEAQTLVSRSFNPFW